MEIRVLGPLEVLSEGQPVNLGGPKQRAVLAALVARAGERLSGDFLLDEVYGDEASRGAKRSIQTYVSNLRRELGEMIHSDRRGYLLTAPPDGIDATRFDRLRAEAAELIESDPVEASELLRQALGLWRGHPYADIDARGVLAAETARLNQARIDALELRIDADLAAGRHFELISELEALTLEHPLRERFRGQHMLALYRSGRQADALRAYAKTRTVLVEELGIDPSSELQTLEMQILDQDPSLTISITSVVERVAILAAEHTVLGVTAADREAAATRRDHVVAERTSASGGEVIDVRRNTVYAWFPSVGQALEAATGLPTDEFRVAVDFGAVDVDDGSISGPPLSRALRLAAVAHPGQVVVTDDAHRSLADTGASGWTLQMLGRFEIRGVGDGMQLFQLAGPEFGDRPPLQLDRMPPPLPDRPAGAIAGYELRELLGEGATGLVYRAYQASVGREVAVRMIRPDVVGDVRFIRRFEAEMQRVLDLSHSAIVPVIDFWRDPSAAFIVNRLVEYPPVPEWRDMERDEAVDLVARIAEAVDYGHSSGLVHGRINPHNVLIDGSGSPHLLGFGLASLFSGLVQFPVLAHTAPEAIDGPPTVAGDVYSLGVLAAEILTGASVPLDGAIPVTGTGLDGAIERATRSEPSDRYPDVASFLSDLVKGMSAVPAPFRRSVRNPFKGLSSFTEADADDFRGRELLVDQLVQAVGRSRLTVVVGSSGIGKSSVVLAGVVPRLRASGQRLVEAMTPGDHPFDALAEALDGVAVAEPAGPVAEVAGLRASLADAVAAVIPPESELVLVIDQFEELFTLASDQERKTFLGAIAENATEPDSPVTVIATMRADFYDRPLDHPRLGQMVAANTIAVHAPTPEGWHALIAEPAENVGVGVDDSLVEAIVEDAESEPGALALVQHALTQMFGDRDEDRLTLDAYRRAGGLAGWIGRTAERIYDSLSDPEKQVARDVFVRLVAVNEETEDTRRRVRQSELDAAGLDWATVQGVMAGFIANRLVVAGRDPATHQPTIEVAHEALIHRWDRLASWIDEAREDLLVARRIELAATDWQAADRAEEFLYRGARLERAEEWARTNAALAGPTQLEFLSESRRVADRESERVRRNRRRALTFMSGALVISLTLGGLAWNARGLAETRAVENRVQRLAVQAENAIEEDPELAMLLALEAKELATGLDPRIQGQVATALQLTTQASRLIGMLPGDRDFLEAGWPHALLEASPDGRLLVVSAGDGSNDVVVYDQQSMREVARFDPGFAPGGGAFSAGGSMLAITPADAALDPPAHEFGARLFDTGSFTAMGDAGEGCCWWWPSFSSDGSWVGAYDGSGGFYTRRLSDGAQRWWPGRFHLTFRWMPGSTKLLQAADGNRLVELDPETGDVEEIQVLPVSDIEWIDVHPSGKSVVVVAGSGVEYWTIGGVTAEWSVAGAGLLEVEFSLDGNMVALYGGSRVLVVSTATGEELASLEGHGGGVAAVSFSADGERLFTRDNSGVKIWDLRPEGRPAIGNVAVSGMPGQAWLWSSNDGRRLSVRESYGTGEQIAVHDIVNGGLLGRSMEFSNGFGPVASLSSRFVGGELPGRRGAIQDLETGAILEFDCGTPLAISDDGRYAALMNTCRLEEDTFMSVRDLETGTDLPEWIGLRPAFGPSDTPAEGLVAFAPVPFEDMHVVSLTTGERLGSMEVGADARFPEFSPDGRYLTFGGFGGGWIIDVEVFRGGASLEEAVVLRPIIEGGRTASAVAAGDMAATTHGGELVRLWDIESGAEWASIPISFGDQSSAIITSDGRYVYYQDRPGVIARMPLDLDELANLARSSVFRDFTEPECQRYEIADDCSVYAEDEPAD